jgi:hypothetical protein
MKIYEKFADDIMIFYQNLEVQMIIVDLCAPKVKFQPNVWSLKQNIIDPLAHNILMYDF